MRTPARHPLAQLPEAAVLEELDIAAKRLLVEQMRLHGISYAGLSERLAKIRVYESADSLNRKVNRQSFRASFLLACLVALEVTTLDLSSIDLSPDARKRRRDNEKWLDLERAERRRKPRKGDAG